jgi:glycine betaine/proline transport system permease protein
MNSLLQFSPSARLAPAVDWLNANFRPLFAAVSSVIEVVLAEISAALLFVPPHLLIAIVAVLAFVLINFRAAILAGLALGFCFVAGLWEASIQTITLVSVAVAISVLIAFPLGILASRVKNVEAVIRPVLDIMQTVPPWVYLIPAVIIFSLGSVPAIIATIIYGIPPMLRLTTLAFNQVPKDLLELGQAIGASRRSILVKI